MSKLQEASDKLQRMWRNGSTFARACVLIVGIAVIAGLVNVGQWVARGIF